MTLEVHIGRSIELDCDVFVVEEVRRCPIQGYLGGEVLGIFVSKTHAELFLDMLEVQAPVESDEHQTVY